MIDRRNPAPGIRCAPAVSASERRRREPETSHMNDHSEDKTGENGMGNTINKHIRVDEDHWKRIEKAAHERGISPSRLMISATIEAIEEREMAPHRSRDPPLALRDVRRPSHHPATWRGPDERRRSRKSAEISPKSRRNCRGTRDRIGLNPWVPRTRVREFSVWIHAVRLNGLAPMEAGKTSTRTRVGCRLCS